MRRPTYALIDDSGVTDAQVPLRLADRAADVDPSRPGRADITPANNRTVIASRIGRALIAWLDD